MSDTEQLSYTLINLCTHAAIDSFDSDYIQHIRLPESPDFYEKLYALAKHHSLTSLTYEALQKIKNDNPDLNLPDLTRFRKAKEQSVMRNILMDREREQLFSYMEEKKIWYMPLKGVILKELYPKLGLREMSDNDILFDNRYREEIRHWFEDCGYKVLEYGGGKDDVYAKKPYFYFEMHFSLFEERLLPEWNLYYQDLRSRLIKDKENHYGFHMSDEDFYVFLVAHAYKHYAESGFGIRHLIDLYIFLRANTDFEVKKKDRMSRQIGSALNWNYILQQLDILHIREFEHTCRQLAVHIFTADSMDTLMNPKPEEKKLLHHMLVSGTYGTLQQKVERSVAKKGKFRYVFNRIFPPAYVYGYYPQIASSKIPVSMKWFWRLGLIIGTKRKRLFKEIKLWMRNITH